MAYIYEGDINMRKKLFVVLAAVLLCFSLSACSFNWEVSFGKPAEEDPEDDDDEDKGFDSSKDVIRAYWQAFADVKKSGFRECFPDPDDAQKGSTTNLDELVKSQYDLAKQFKDSVTILMDDIEIDKPVKVDVDDIDTLENVNSIVAELYDIEKLEVTDVVVPMEQIVDGKTYLVEDCYEMVTARIDGRWYLINVFETDVRATEASGQG